MPFLLIVYLGMRGGGDDAIVRGEIGIAAWWIVLLGAAIGALPVARLGRGAWIALGLLAGFAMWTAIGISWSESAERSVAEFGRVAALLGVFALALTAQNAEGLRRMVHGVAAGIAVVGVVALLSRLQPSWFPELEVPEFITESEVRLHYPLDYWNGLGALLAIGMPLLVALISGARHTVVRVLAAAAVPALALALFYTLSRGGVLAAVIALATLFALHPARRALASHTVPAAVGSAILVGAANQRDQLLDGLTSTTADVQGNEMLAMTLAVCAGVGLLTLALVLAQRHGALLPLPTPPPVPGRAVAAVGVLVVVVALIAGLPGAASDAWEDFKDPEVPTAEAGRFDSTSGSGRYQFWEAAGEAGWDEPLTGIGAGTYEFYWAREGTLPTFIRDAHSLLLETFAELGVVGLALVLAILASPFVFGLRGVRALDSERRVLLAGALGGCAAFAFAAAIDWVWEVTVIPLVFLLLAAAVIARPPAGEPSAHEERPAPLPRFLLPGLAVLGMIAVAIPMASTDALRDSEADVRAGDLSAALEEARSAAYIEPYAATPELQEALVLEMLGDVDGAVVAAREATEQESTNWRTWLTLSRLESQAGNPEGAVEAYREARDLNPRSALFK